MTKWTALIILKPKSPHLPNQVENMPPLFTHQTKSHWIFTFIVRCRSILWGGRVGSGCEGEGDGLLKDDTEEG